MALLNRTSSNPEDGPEIDDVVDLGVPVEPEKRGFFPKKEKKPSAPKVMRPSRVRWGRVMIGGTVAIAAGGGMYALSASLAPTTVQVAQVNTTVSANTQLAAGLFDCVEVSASAFPAGTFTCDGIAKLTEPMFAAKDLVAGDWVSDDTFAPATRIDLATLSDSSLLAQSFVADAEAAVAGRLRPGDLVNILTTTQAPDGGAPVTSYLLTKVLLLDVSAEPATRSQAAASETIGGAAPAAAVPVDAVARLYTVALNPEQTTILTSARGQDLTVVLTRADAPDIKGAASATVAAPAAPVAEPLPADAGATATQMPAAPAEVSPTAPAASSAPATPSPVN